jgi:hypothetical protein
MYTVLRSHACLCQVQYCTHHTTHNHSYIISLIPFLTYIPPPPSPLHQQPPSDITMTSNSEDLKPQTLKPQTHLAFKMSTSNAQSFTPTHLLNALLLALPCANTLIFFQAALTVAAYPTSSRSLLRTEDSLLLQSYNLMADAKESLHRTATLLSLLHPV